ncbi:MAG: hypothetical protein COV72_09065 [Candidatus Omnitrophica bacterium CG11_big_fil_rev_8_21_14_0_20_42_13]|uniref:Uncharacterized protein n=1 Tax=Candidatus Ghiorseimicrobium undicola TaxID=1974746 RepID=A0A2H0LX58_9BACT|nr:MAG: hypothetical protein COV72_09065 [Candidatus Omnitrophica bacterium CG11_big_fil_rev_8_21_14_0_20_42_13]
MYFLFLTVFALFALAAGLFFALRPSDTIELQRRFYLLINWNISPVSMDKEVRNTRLMGLFLVLISILTFSYVFYQFHA